MYLNDTDLSVELITAVNTVAVCAAVTIIVSSARKRILANSKAKQGRWCFNKNPFIPFS